MTQSKSSKAAASRKGAAARAEKDPKPKIIDFRGAKLKGPAELPGSLDFDIGDLQLRMEAGEESELVGLQRILQDILGREELLKVRETITSLRDPWQRELINALFAAYGADAGEASASAKS